MKTLLHRPFAHSWRLLLLLLLPALPALAQLPATPGLAAAYGAQKSLVISTIHYAEARPAMLAFIRRRGLRLQKQEETPEQLIAEFVLPFAAVPALDSLAAATGYVQENNLNRRNLNLDLRAPAAAQDEQVYVTLRLYDEISFPVANRRVSFVNMPGVEFGYLRLDHPRPGLSAAAYQGYSVKYLVTRGKSYFNLGLYKPTQPATEPADSLLFNELAVINFGQDFYPRNFGRGKRRYLNLYTGYQVGGFIASRVNERHSTFIPNVNLSLGVEVVKTKHVLLDVKESYFLPLHPDSRNLRGLLFQGAFNFVF